MRFRPLLSSSGTTGWTFRMFCVPFSGPALKLVFFWKGALTRWATGFCASSASSSELGSARAAVAANPGTAAASAGGIGIAPVSGR